MQKELHHHHTEGDLCKGHNFDDYLDWRGDLSFSAAPFCEVDNLILSMCCYLNFGDIISDSYDEVSLFKDAMTEFLCLPQEKQSAGAILPSALPVLARKTAFSKRFAGMQVTGFVNEIDEVKKMQFSALTYILPDGSLFVSFRGTDDTIVGWKEDFMLAFTSPVPAQSRAVRYLCETAYKFPDVPIRVGGHSKGGNLAIYASICANQDVQERLVCAYNNDGPGFMPEVLEDPGYLAVADKLVTYVPQSSIVGVLLHHAGKMHIIRSTQKNVLQHDPYSWVVTGPKFVYERGRSSFGRMADATLDRWIDGLSFAERKAFVENLFIMIESSGAKTLGDIVADKIKSARAMIASFARMDKKDREIMWRITHRLVRASRESEKIEDQIKKINKKAQKDEKKALPPSPKKEKKTAQIKAPKQEKAKLPKPKKEQIKKSKKPAKS